MQNSIYFFNKIATLWSLEVNKAFLEQVKLAEWYYDYMFQFFKKQKLCTQNKFQKHYSI